MDPETTPDEAAVQVADEPTEDGAAAPEGDEAEAQGLETSGELQADAPDPAAEDVEGTDHIGAIIALIAAIAVAAQQFWVRYHKPKAGK